ncbi:hypothetical protein B566_EDAN010942 [Ephemera danica]|nr:hypothetical protein B566_EDAN010942 [Ephemera danica]
MNAYLIKNSTTKCKSKHSWRGNYSCLRVELEFTRDRAFYFTTVFIPGIILVTSSFITFWLEWNAVPARVMIGVTTMLNFFTTSNGFRSTLPVVSNLTAMNVWDGMCMCFIYASLLEFVCVNYVGRKRPLHNVVYRPGENPVAQNVAPNDAGGNSDEMFALDQNDRGHHRENGENKKAMVRDGDGDDGALSPMVPRTPARAVTTAGTNDGIVACTNCSGDSCSHHNNGCHGTSHEVRKKEPSHPIRVAKTIDVISRIVFPVAYAIFLIFFFIHYKAFA